MESLGGAGVGPATGRGSIQLTFAIEGWERFDVALSRFGRGIADWRPFFRDYLAPKFFDDVRSNFEQEGAAVGGWPPLSARYAAWKARHYPGKTILRRTDTLFDSLSYGHWGNVGRQGIFRMTETQAELGTAVRYGIYHQSARPRHVMPLRRFLFLLPSARQEYGKLAHTFVIDQMKLAGLTASGRERLAPFNPS